MSIYSDCSQAISRLAELPAVFTEIDVVNEAASDGWSKANFKEARKYANQIVSAKFRSGEVVRYGAVEYEGIQDYARRASMIVYGGAESGPTTWDTPNGSFAQIPRHLDTIQTSGRKKGTARHDELPWAEQDAPEGIRLMKVKGGSNSGRRKAADTKSNAHADEIARLTEELSRLRAENERLRAEKREGGSVSPAGTEPASGGLSRHEIEEIVTDLVGEVEERVEERVAKVEKRMDGLMAFAGQA